MYKYKDSKKTAIKLIEEGEDNVKSSWPLWAGLHMCYNGFYNKKQKRNLEQILKKNLSSNYFLKLGNMKL